MRQTTIGWRFLCEFRRNLHFHDGYRVLSQKWDELLLQISHWVVKQKQQKHKFGIESQEV